MLDFNRELFNASYMNNVDKKIIESLISGVGGAGGAYLISVLGGPIGMVIAAAGLGTAIGPMVADKVGRVSFLVLKNHQNKIRFLMEKKFKSEIEHSFCFKEGYVNKKTEEILNNLRNLGVFSKETKDKRFSGIEKRQLSSFKLLENSQLIKDISALSIVGQISISTSSILVSACAALQSMKDKYETDYGLKIELSPNFPNGLELVSSLIKGERPDFLISPIDPFSLIPETYTKDYRLVIPMNTEFQYLFVKKGKTFGKHRLVHVYEESSAKFHFELGTGIPRNSEDIRFSNPEFFGEVENNISSGDCIIAWEPIANLLRENDYFDEIPSVRHEVIFCLFCHKSWLNHNKRRYLDSFVRVLTHEFIYSGQNEKVTLKKLRKNLPFMDSFAKGAGLIWTPEL